MANYTIAGVPMEIEPRTDFTKKLLKDYETPEAVAECRIIPCPDEAEEIGLLRRVGLELLEHYMGMFLHGAAVLYKGKVYLFTAPSGTGKSTHVALWKKLLGHEAVILNGDKPFLRWIDGCAMVYGSPWRGKEGWGENSNGPLGGIFILRRGDKDAVAEISDLDALNSLLSETIYPDDPSLTEKMLDLIGRIMESVPVRLLYCTPNPGAVQAVLQAIEGEGA